MTTATKFYTWDEIWAEVSDLTDTADEDFVDQAEAMRMANRAVDEAEALIHVTNEDYFMTRATLTLVAAQEEYDLPASIYAHKIKKVIYRNGQTVYEIVSLKHLSKLLEYQALVAAGVTSVGQRMRYFILNTEPGEPKILLTPTPAESGAYVTVWHYRNANRFETGDDVCDIPEFASFVKAYLIEWIYWKIAAGSPRHVTAQEETNNQRRLMTTTLRDMLADGNNEVEMDLSFYEDCV